MGLLDNVRGNASEVGPQEAVRQFGFLMIQGETVVRAYSVFRDMLLFTDRRLILVDVQGVTGKKVEYHSIPYRSIIHFKVETAGTLDMDSELRIYLSGGHEIYKQFGKKSDIGAVQHVLAHHVLTSR